MIERIWFLCGKMSRNYSDCGGKFKHDNSLNTYKRQKAVYTLLFELLESWVYFSVSLTYLNGEDVDNNHS